MDSNPEAPRTFSQQKYWRYVFTPLLLFLIGFGIYILFNMPDTQTLNFRGVQTSLQKLGILNAASSGSNIGSNAASLGSFSTLSSA
jgi:hypothetical protein